MGRQIKFRIWNLKFQDWEIKDKITLDCDGYVIYNDRRESSFIMDDDSLVVQQYTGLKDSQDKEIYEGDILRDKFGFSYEVYWHDACASFELAEIKEVPHGCPTPIFRWRDVLSLGVAGNRYENPELLKS
jgi:uncharacterized phage protein (TIGR01671 family)